MCSRKTFLLFILSSYTITACLLLIISSAVPALDKPDKFRWMETDHEKTLHWLESKSNRSQKILDSLPQKSVIDTRLKQVANFYSNPSPALYCNNAPENENCFYFSWTDEFPYNRIFMQDPKGNPILLVDPPEGYTIGYFISSYDKQYIAYALSKEGSESVLIKFIRVKDKRILSETISSLYFPNIRWSNDSHSLFYTRKSINSPNTKETYARIYRHDLGTQITQDTLLFDKKNAAGLMSKQDAYLSFNAHDAIVTVSAGVSGFPVEIYQTNLNNLKKKSVIWKKIIDKKQGVENFYFYNNWLYITKYNGASGYVLSRLNLDKPKPTEEKILEWEQGSIEYWDMMSGHFFIAYTEFGKRNVKWFPLSNISDIKQMETPDEGRIEEINFDSDRKVITYKLATWLKPPTLFTYYYDTQTLEKSIDTKEDRFANYTAEVKWVKSANNVRVPLTVIHRKEIKLNGSSPTWLTTYGAYGIEQVPFFDSDRLVWLEQGGIIAIAHIRGGGELGPGWHLAGSGVNKENSIIDFIQCAEFLIDNQYTNSKKLVISGRSAGGITVGMALIKRPDLFAAAAIDAGMLNVSRLDKMPIGEMNYAELGSPLNQNELANLIKIDAYLNLREKVKYPPILLTVGSLDERVPIWQTAKFAARLKALSTQESPPLFVLLKKKRGHFFYNTPNYLNFFLWRTRLAQ